MRRRRVAYLGVSSRHVTFGNVTSRERGSESWLQCGCCVSSRQVAVGNRSVLVEDLDGDAGDEGARHALVALVPERLLSKVDRFLPRIHNIIV